MDLHIRCNRTAASLLKALSIVLAVVPALAAPMSAQPSTDMKALIDDLVAANRILYRQGVVDGFGHISVRHPQRADRFLMSAPRAPGRVGKHDIREFDLDAKIPSWPPRPGASDADIRNRSARCG